MELTNQAHEEEFASLQNTITEISVWLIDTASLRDTARQRVRQLREHMEVAVQATVSGITTPPFN